MIPEMVFADPLAHNVWDKLTNEVLDATKGWILNDIVMYPLLYLILCLFYQKFTPQLARIINEVENTFDTLTKNKKNGFK